MKGETEAMKIFDIVKAKKMLPADQGKLAEIRFIGTAAMAYYRAKLKLMDQLGIAEKQRDATLADGQDAGEMLLDVEVKLGEIYQTVPRASSRPKTSSGRVDEVPKAKKIGRPAQRIHETEQVAKNPEIVAAVKKEARERKDIPTKTAVLTSIKNQRLMNELKEVNEKKKRERILNREKPPTIDRYIAGVEQAGDDYRSKLAVLEGKIQYIESALNKETLKISLDAVYNTIGRIRKEF